MARFKFHLRVYRRQINTFCILLLVIVALLILTGYPDVIEAGYSTTIYPLVCYILHPIFNIFPFSVGDVFYVALIFYGFYALIRIPTLLFKKRFTTLIIYLLKLLVFTEVLVLVFYLFWGLNYFRPSAAKRLGLTDTSYTFADIKAVTSTLIDSANTCRAKLTRADLNQDNDAIYKSAQMAIRALPASGLPNLQSIHPNIKPSALTFVLNYIGTEGYYNPFTSEAQLNYQMPVYLRPVVACHEMSHQMGFGSEDEANFIGFVAGINSKNRLLKYSAYYLGVQELMYAVRRQDSTAFKTLKLKILPQVKADFKTDRQYWQNYESKAGILSSILYDNYLKVNNQPQGLNTYNRMVKLAMAWYVKKRNVNK